MEKARFSSELRELAAALETIASEGKQPEIAVTLETLIAVCQDFDDVSSKSWLGYHSLVYYKDFQTPNQNDAYVIHREGGRQMKVSFFLQRSLRQEGAS